MRLSTKQLVAVLVIIGLAFLPSCGGDKREVKVQTSSPETVPNQVENILATAALAVSKAKAAEKHDSEVLLRMTLIHNELERRKTLFRNAYAKFLASQKVNPAPANTPASVNSHGPHSDAWWHGVSVCEQGGRNDSYFGYFSYMDGSAGGKDWATQVRMGNATIAQYGEDMNNGGAWAHKCVMAGYAASPNG